MIIVLIYIFLGAVAFGFGLICLCAEVGHGDRFKSFLSLIRCYDWEVIATIRIGFCTRRIIAVKKLAFHIETHHTSYCTSENSENINFYSCHALLIKRIPNECEIRSLQILPHPYAHIIDYGEDIVNLDNYFHQYNLKDLNRALTPIEFALMRILSSFPVHYWESIGGEQYYAIENRCITDETSEKIIRECLNTEKYAIVRIPVFGIFTV